MHLKTQKAQTSVEYLLLLMAVVAIILVGFKTYMPEVHDAANIYYNRAAVGIYGEPPKCGDNVCDPVENVPGRCPVDC